MNIRAVFILKHIAKSMELRVRSAVAESIIGCKTTGNGNAKNVISGPP